MGYEEIMQREKIINEAMESRFDGIEACEIVGELLDVEAENKALQAENKLLKEENRWIPISERLPEYIEGLNQSERIFILDGKRVCVGGYHNEKFEYWGGSWCNLDNKNSQDSITHWKPIILPEQALKGGK